MRKFWSKLARPFHNPCFRLPFSRRRTLSIFDIVEDANDSNVCLDATPEVKEGIEPKEPLEAGSKSPSKRAPSIEGSVVPQGEKLDNASSSRIQPDDRSVRRDATLEVVEGIEPKEPVEAGAISPSQPAPSTEGSGASQSERVDSVLNSRIQPDDRSVHQEATREVVEGIEPKEPVEARSISRSQPAPSIKGSGASQRARVDSTLSSRIQPDERSVHQEATLEVVEGIEPKEPVEAGSISQSQPAPSIKGSVASQSSRLDSLLGFRINLDAINFTSPGSHGSGSGSDVVQATLRQRDGKDEVVAVKKLRCHKEAVKDKSPEEFAHEVEVMSELTHKNIVRLIGFVEDLEKGEGWIVTSWEANGNVSEFLATGKWEIPERVSLMRDTFEGLNYLHTRQPPICHGDLTSLNIVVSLSHHAMITDFGSAHVVESLADKPLDQEQDTAVKGNLAAEATSPPINITAAGNELTLTAPAWSLGWASPEVVKGEGPSLSSDIWAAGWVCWEIITGQAPFPELNSADAIASTLVQGKVPSAIEDEQVPQIMGLCNMMKECWAFDPKDRPTAGRCRNDLQWMPLMPLLDEQPSGPSVPTTQDPLEPSRNQELEDGDEEAVSLFHESNMPMDEDDQDEEYQEASADALFSLGELYRTQSKFSEAEQTWVQSLEIYTRIDHTQGQADTLLGLGHVHRLQSKYQEAEQSFTRAQEIYTSDGDDLGRANSLQGLGQIYHIRSRYAEAEQSYKQAEEIYALNGNEWGQANTLDGLGEVYRSLSKYANAERCFSRAQEIFIRVGDDIGQANMLGGLGEICRLRSKYAEAEQFFIRAQEIYARVGDDYGRARMLTALGDTYRLQRKYTEAEDSYLRAEEIYVRIGENGGGRANTLDGLGAVYCAQSRYTKAEESYLQAQEIYAHIGDDLGHGNTLLGLASIYRLQSKYTEAEDCYTRAQDSYSLIGNYPGQANTLILLGHVYLLQTKYTEAERSYTRAQDIYCHIGDDRGRANTRCAVGHVRRRENRYAEAACFFSEARDIFADIRDADGEETASHWLGIVSRQQASPSMISLSRNPSLQSRSF